MNDVEAFWKRVDLLAKKPLYALADECGIKRNRLYSLRSKKRYPSVSESVELALSLKVPLNYLMTGKAPPIPEDTCREAELVESSENLQAIIRACLRDETLIFKLLNILRYRI